MAREDHFTSTVEGAAGWAYAHGDADYGDRPTRGEAEADEAYLRGPDTYSPDAPGPRRGIRCAHCKARHATVADVRWCGDLAAEARAEAEAEQAAEAAAERAYAEDRERIAESGTWFGPVTEMDQDPAEATDVMLNRFGSPMHETPCVCSVYDRCNGVRAEDAAKSGNWRDRFRAYND
jgi:hypothetical protein